MNDEIDYSEIDMTGTAGIVEEWMECEHSFVKVTGKKSKEVTYCCIYCPEKRVEEVRPVSKIFKIKIKNSCKNEEEI